MAAGQDPFAKFLTHFNEGHVLFHEGDDGRGHVHHPVRPVAIKKKVKDGDTTLAVLEKGDFFGEMAILERAAALGHAPRWSRTGDLIVISGEIFGDMIKANPEIAVRMLRKQSIRLRETNKPARAGAEGRRRRRPGAAAEAARRPRRHRGHAAGRGPGLLHLRRRPATSSRCSAARRSSAASTP